MIKKTLSVTNVTYYDDAAPYLCTKKQKRMAKRSIIKIDEDLCDGCGACVDGCHEGALQLIDGKARMVSELYCDGLGACIGECPVGAIEIEEREAEPYDERAVMERISPKGAPTILAHLKHLKDHGEMSFLQQGLDYLREKGLAVAGLEALSNPHVAQPEESGSVCGCPGSMARSFAAPSSVGFTMASQRQNMPSQLAQWPVQLHLLNPQAGYFQGADVVLAADCVAYAYADFHNRFLRNHTLAIACPKLDSNKESYIAKLVAMIDQAQINTLTVVIMEVPCCGGLFQLARIAVGQASRRIPVKSVVIGIEGEIQEESWN